MDEILVFYIVASDTRKQHYITWGLAPNCYLGKTQEHSPGSTSNIVADEFDVTQRNLDGTLIRHKLN